MSSRETILATLRRNKPGPSPLPETTHFQTQEPGDWDKLEAVLKGIGGTSIYRVKDRAALLQQLQQDFAVRGSIATAVPYLDSLVNGSRLPADAHALQHVVYGVVEAQLAVAENGAVWLPEEALQVRALPFIVEQLVVIIDKDKLVPTMHDAYAHIGAALYGFGVFVAGPSKTADIEQSLVLGAHGPESMHLFIVG